MHFTAQAHQKSAHQLVERLSSPQYEFQIGVVIPPVLVLQPSYFQPAGLGGSDSTDGWALIYKDNYFISTR